MAASAAAQAIMDQSVCSENFGDGALCAGSDWNYCQGRADRWKVKRRRHSALLGTASAIEPKRAASWASIDSPELSVSWQGGYRHRHWYARPELA
jgi:hypothetical protein